MKQTKDILRLMRPRQWVKNLFIFLPLFFDRQLLDAEKLLSGAVAFAGFSLITSSIYCLNDIVDAESDRRHKDKKNRPVASGAVSSATAGILSAVLFLAGISILCLYTSMAVAGLALFYWLMNLLYIFRLKRYAIVDVFVIAVGFVLRIFIGGVADDVPLSHWIVLITFLLALFLGFAKRRDDVLIYENENRKMRSNIARYNSMYLTVVMMITATITIMAYIMYTVDAGTIERMGSDYVYVTSVFVIAGIFRYLQLAIVDHLTGSPTKVLLKDPFVQLCVLGWVAAYAIIIYG